MSSSCVALHFVDVICETSLAIVREASDVLRKRKKGHLFISLLDIR